MHNPPAYIACRTIISSTGKIQSIAFWNIERGWTNFCSATIVTETIAMEEDGAFWCSLENFLAVMFKLIKHRGNLPALLDFAPFMVDDHGTPNVIRHTLFCDACEHRWTSVDSQIKTKFRCPRCHNTVEALPPAIEWIGPPHPLLKELWELLPPSGDIAIRLSGGLAITRADYGFGCEDPLGHRLLVSTKKDGLMITVISADNATARVELGKDGIKITDAGGATRKL